MSAPRRVAIFGATSAIAADIARCYANAGSHLALIGRSHDKLARLAEELGSAVLLVREQDFAVTQEAESCVHEILTQLGQLDVAIIAHGLLGDQLKSEQHYDEAEEIARVNYLSVMALLIPLANALEKQGSGKLAVLSTVAAERGRPRNYTYAAAKAALNVYLQGLRSRLYPSGVTVHTIKLGPVDTPMTATHKKNLLFARSPDVAEQVVDVIARGKSEVFVPPFWALVMPIVRHLPEAVFQRVGALSGR